MRVLSLFDGISCGRVALEKAGIPVSAYIASEVDKYAMKVSADNWPDIIQIGDVRNVATLVESGALGVFDMVIGGSPCQSLSFAGKQAGLSTKEGIEITTLEQYIELRDSGFEFEGQSYLFWEYVLVLDAVRRQNPDVKFLLENVRMSKKWLEVFNRIMGVDGVLINSALVCAQNRQRYYWCNWQVEQPEDRGILLRDIIERDVNIKETAIDIGQRKRLFESTDLQKSFSKIDPDKAGAMTARQYANWKGNFLSCQKITNVNPSGNGMNGWVYGIDAKSPTLTTNKGEGVKITGTAFPREAGNLEVRKDGKSNALLSGGHQSRFICTTHVPKITMKQLPRGNNKGFEKEVTKAPCMSANSWEHNNHVSTNAITYRKLTVTECCRLMGLYDLYCKAVSNSQAYKALGNGWQVDTIEHLFRELLRTDMKFFQLWLSKVAV